MPFNSSGVYTPPTGAQNAAPGVVIRSTTWNTIFTDISAALTTLGQASPAVAAPTTLSAASAYTVVPADRVVLVSAAVGTIVLGAATLRAGNLTIMGTSTLFFGTNSVVLLPTGADKISGAGSLVLNRGFQATVLYALPSGGYVVIS